MSVSHLYPRKSNMAMYTSPYHCFLLGWQWSLVLAPSISAQDLSIRVYNIYEYLWFITLKTDSSSKGTRVISVKYENIKRFTIPPKIHEKKKPSPGLWAPLFTPTTSSFGSFFVHAAPCPAARRPGGWRQRSAAAGTRAWPGVVALASPGSCIGRIGAEGLFLWQTENWG